MNFSVILLTIFSRKLFTLKHLSKIVPFYVKLIGSLVLCFQNTNFPSVVEIRVRKLKAQRSLILMNMCTKQHFLRYCQRTEKEICLTPCISKTVRLRTRSSFEYVSTLYNLGSQIRMIKKTDPTNRESIKTHIQCMNNTIHHI